MPGSPLPVHANGDPPDLFSDAPAPANAPAGALAGMLRSRYVSIHPEVLQPVLSALRAGRTASLTLNLFADVQVPVVFERLEDSVTGGITLVGKDPASAYSLVILAQQGDVYSANIDLTSQKYMLEYAGEDTHVIAQVNPQAAPADGPAPIPPGKPVGDVTALGVGRDDDGSRIDVMFVYTPAARSYWGGTAAIQNEINDAVAEANATYINSGINQRVTLVHTAELNYNENQYTSGTGNDWNKILDDLTGTSDGKIDNVHSLRETYAADVVVFIILRSEYGGLGWLMTYVDPNYFAGYAFSLISAYWPSGYYIAAYEMGHNMGAHHDRTTCGCPGSSCQQGAYSYSYGNYFTSIHGSRVRTVMSYNHDPGYASIPYWSNPDVNYDDTPTGVSSSSPNSSDNRLTLNNTASTVAKFRDGAAPAAPSLLTGDYLGGGEVRLNWQDNSFDESLFRIERYYNSTWTEINTVAGNTTTYLDNDPTNCNRNYQYRVRASGGNGYSDYSNTVSVMVNCKPAAPTNLQATSSPSADRIDLTWTDNADDEIGYAIDRRLAGDTGWTTIQSVAVANTQSYNDTTAACGINYEYQVRAYHAFGVSDPSNMVSSGVRTCVPGSASASGLTQKRIQITWIDNNQNESGYKIERATHGGSDWQVLQTLAANTTSAEDSGLTCGTSYDYRVRGVNTWVGDGPASGTFVGATHACGSPPQPGGLATAPYSATGIFLSWTDILDDESGYQVWRAASCAAAWPGSWTQVASPSENEVQYVDRNIEWGTTSLCYRVVAVNAYGPSTASSPQAGGPYPYAILMPGYIVP